MSQRLLTFSDWNSAMCGILNRRQPFLPISAIDIEARRQAFEAGLTPSAWLKINARPIREITARVYGPDGMRYATAFPSGMDEPPPFNADDIGSEFDPDSPHAFSLL